MGKSKQGLTYYWNDSGAKQLNLPTAPYLTQMFKMNEDIMSRGELQGNVTRGLRLMSHMNGFNISLSELSYQNRGSLSGSLPPTMLNETPVDASVQPITVRHTDSEGEAALDQTRRSRDNDGVGAISSELAAKAGFSAPGE